MINVQSPNPLISANNANEGNRLDGLTRRQDRALKALLDAPGSSGQRTRRRATSEPDISFVIDLR